LAFEKAENKEQRSKTEDRLPANRKTFAPDSSFYAISGCDKLLPPDFRQLTIQDLARRLSGNESTGIAGHYAAAVGVGRGR
jgi:hypothetical protein